MSAVVPVIGVALAAIAGFLVGFVVGTRAEAEATRRELEEFDL